MAEANLSHQRQPHPFINAARMAEKSMLNKCATLVGKVEKINSNSSLTIRTSDGKFFVVLVFAVFISQV